MRNLTPILLMATYFFLSLAVAAYAYNRGTDTGGILACLLGSLALFVGFHGLISQALSQSRLSKDIGLVRDAHRLMVEAIEATQRDMVELADQVQDNRTSRSEELTSEVKMLENLVLKLGESIEERMNDWKGPATISHGRGEAKLGPREQQAMTMLEIVRQALIDNRVDLYLQPIVSLPQRKTIFYESFSRLRDETGRVLMPSEYMSVAETEGLIPSIDNLLLFRCVQIVRRLAKQDRRIGIFCNISLTSLRDEVFFPQFLEFLNENKDLSSALIFELGQDIYLARGSIEARNMAKLADMGYRFSIDKVMTIDLDLQDLQRSDVRFVKIGANILIDQLFNSEGKPALRFLKDIHAGDYASLLSRYGVEVIVEKVESEKQVIDILDMEILYGQGHLFGEPRAIKEQVLAETDPPAGFIRASLPQSQRRRA